MRLSQRQLTLMPIVENAAFSVAAIGVSIATVSLAEVLHPMHPMPMLPMLQAWMR